LNSGHYPPGGHVAALYQDELYQMATGAAGYARLNRLASYSAVKGS
jgi:hypothetical protein